MVNIGSILRSVVRVVMMTVVVGLFVPASHLTAQTLYVDDDGPGTCSCGSSGGSCGQSGSPFHCIQDAINASTWDTIIVRDGTYRESLNVYRSGTSDTQRKTIKADHIHGAWISGGSNTSVTVYANANYVTISGFRISGGSTGFYVDGYESPTPGNPNPPQDSGLGVVAEDDEVFGNTGGVLTRKNCANLRLTRLDVHDNAPYNGISLDTYLDGVGFYNVTDTIIENSHIHHNHNQGIGEGDCLRTIVRNSEIDHNGTNGYTHGLYMKGSMGLIQSNKVHHNAGYGLHLWAAPWGGWLQHYIVERNDVFANGAGIVLGGSSAEHSANNDGYPHYVEIRNNISHDNIATGFVYYGAGCDPNSDTSDNNTFHHNTIYNNGSPAVFLAGLGGLAGGGPRLWLKDNIIEGATMGPATPLVFLDNTQLQPHDLDGNIYYVPGASSSTPGTVLWRCALLNGDLCFPDTIYSLDQIQTSGVVQDTSLRPDLGCSTLTATLDERSRWTDPMVVDPKATAWPNPLGMTRGDYHLRRGSPAASGGVCCSPTLDPTDYDGEPGPSCTPSQSACFSQNGNVFIGADFPLDTNLDGVANRNECSPNNGTVCDCNTQNATDCVAENPEVSEASELQVCTANPGAPYDSAVKPNATELCDGKDNDCNPATSVPGGEIDADHDGFFACADCNDSNALVHPGAVEGSAIISTCFDGIDNDCDGIVDLDCAIDAAPASQNISPGQLLSGSQANLAATSINNTYESVREALLNSNYQLGMWWTFPTGSVAHGINFELRVEGYRSSGGNDQFNFTSSTLTHNGVCASGDLGSTTILSITDQPPDPNKLIVADVGFDQDAYCIKVKDSKTTGDSSIADTLTLDRVFLFPTPVAVVDYPAAGDTPVSYTYLSNFTSTQQSEDLYETMPEQANGSGQYRLWHTWQFNSVPAGHGHLLHVEGNRTVAQGGTVDDFNFWWSTNPATWSSTNPTVGFAQIPGAVINQLTDPAGGIDSSQFGTMLFGTFYIRVIDAQKTGSSGSQSTVNIDHLVIKTKP